MKTLALVGLTFLFGSIGCGGSSKSYQYEFVESGGDAGAGCATGKQVFSSLAAMCAGLESASLNQQCALSARQAFFVSEGCSGTFQETN